MKNEWIRALGNMTYGIYVLTSSHEGEINGMIASWVSQVSYDPLLIMVAVHSNRYSHHLIEQSGTFALHVLGRGQSAFLTRFKGSDPRGKFSDIQWTRGQTGCPIIKECLAYFECRVTAQYAPGNHTLFVGEVVGAQSLAEGTAFSSMDYNGVYLGKE